MLLSLFLFFFITQIFFQSKPAGNSETPEVTHEYRGGYFFTLMMGARKDWGRDVCAKARDALEPALKLPVLTC